MMELFKRLFRGIDKSTIILWFIILIGFAVRFWRLWDPGSYMYDESYYAKYAIDLIQNRTFIDVHPAMGEILITIGIKLIGNISFGWRIIPLICGVSIIPLSYYFAKKLTKNTFVGLIIAFLVAIDGLMIVSSRFALLNIFVGFFVILMYCSALKYLDSKKWAYLGLAAISFGCAMSVQWVALPFGLFIVFWLCVSLWKEKKKLLPALVAFGVISIFIYFISFLVLDREGKDLISYLIFWHERSWSFHTNLVGNHVNASRWYTWLLLYRPPWYGQSISDSTASVILALGNPIIWWSGIVALITGIITFIFVKQIRKIIWVPLISFIFFYCGWAIIGREQFLYYIVPALPFYFFLLAYFLFYIYRFNKIIVGVWLTLVFITFVYFYPVYVGRTISINYYKNLMWFDEWRADYRLSPTQIKT